MNEISPETLHEVLKHYRPGCRPLKSAEIEYPVVSGKFILEPTFYHVPSCNHATDIEIQLCLNQLAYCGVLESIKTELIPELEGMDFAELRANGMLITESKKRFRKPIRIGKEFYGEINLIDWREIFDKIVSHANFDFEDRSCFGSLELILVKPTKRASSDASGRES